MQAPARASAASRATGTCHTRRDTVATSLVPKHIILSLFSQPCFGKRVIFWALSSVTWFLVRLYYHGLDRLRNAT